MIRLSNLKYHYRSSDFRLDLPELIVNRGAKVAIIGPSGSGKSTLLNLIAGTILPVSGEIQIDNVNLNHLNDAHRRDFRAQNIGFVFQDFELLEYLSVDENVKLPFLINRKLKWEDQTEQHRTRMLEQMGLHRKRRCYPHQLSHGERQRVAIARALIAAPKIVVADEPTGSLDPGTAREVMALLIEQTRQNGTTLILVTHDNSILHYFDQTIDLAKITSTTGTPLRNEMIEFDPDSKDGPIS